MDNKFIDNETRQHRNLTSTHSKDGACCIRYSSGVDKLQSYTSDTPGAHARIHRTYLRFRSLPHSLLQRLQQPNKAFCCASGTCKVMRPTLLERCKRSPNKPKRFPRPSVFGQALERVGIQTARTQGILGAPGFIREAQTARSQGILGGSYKARISFEVPNSMATWATCEVRPLQKTHPSISWEKEPHTSRLLVHI